jgi:hypothetical protein
MSERKPLPVVPLMAVCAGVVLLLAAYVGGYFWLGDRVDASPFDSPGTFRCYNTKWQARAFRPAARIEAWVTGKDIRLSVKEISEDGSGWLAYPLDDEN